MKDDHKLNLSSSDSQDSDGNNKHRQWSRPVHSICVSAFVQIVWHFFQKASVVLKATEQNKSFQNAFFKDTITLEIAVRFKRITIRSFCP